MQHTLRRVKVACDDLRYFLKTAGHSPIDGLLFFGAWPMQDKVGHLLGEPECAWMPDAQPKPPEVGTAELGGNVAHAIVPPVPAALLQPNIAWGDIEFVVDHQNLLGRDLMKPCERRYRCARAIHKGLWAGEPDRNACGRSVYRHLTDASLEL